MNDARIIKKTQEPRAKARKGDRAQSGRARTVDQQQKRKKKKQAKKGKEVKRSTAEK